MPQRIGLVGFNDEPIMSLLHPTVSSVVQPAFEMGKLAVKAFIEQMQTDEALHSYTTLLKPKLVARASSMRQ